MTRLDPTTNPPGESASVTPCALVVGYGLVGRLVTERLSSHGCRVTIVELNSKTVETQNELDRSCTFGDARDADTLREAGIDRAHALIVTVPDDDVAVEIVRVARSLMPDLYIAARTSFVSRGLKAKAVGANDVVIEEVVTAEAMDRLVSRQWCSLDDRPGPSHSAG